MGKGHAGIKQPKEGAMRFKNNWILVPLLASTISLNAPLWACHDGSPLILDLDGDRVRTTGLFFSVLFDIDGDGLRDRIGWTYGGSQEAFLWLDLNDNHIVDSGRELFGDATLLPTAENAEHGFEALAVYDAQSLGGNEDGLITPQDLIWDHLRLWIDENHDGLSQPREITTLSAAKVVAIGLDFERVDELDGGGNMHRYRGAFVKRRDSPGPPVNQTQSIDDVFFRIAHDD